MRAEESSVTFSTVRTDEVPGALNELEAKYAPAQLYCAGDLSLLRRSPHVAVIGSRRASPEGLRRAASLTRALVDHKMVVMSGLAEGIDTAAHTAALDAGGATIAVIGTPLDVAYPKRNAALQARLACEQLVVSQFGPGEPVGPRNFPNRNRTMALLADATVIVEAGASSGTRGQGWEALRLGRRLFLLESLARDPRLRWPRQMIDHGAQVLTRENLGASLEDLAAKVRSPI